MNDFTMEEAAKAIGGATARAHHLTCERTNRILTETRVFGDIAMAAADGFEDRYSKLLEQAEKFTYTIKVLTENNFPSALEGLENGIRWLREHKDESIDKSFMLYYMRGNTLDIYKSEIRLAREKAGLTQKQFAEMFDVPIDTIKSWDLGRRRPDKLKEKLIIEKLKQVKTNI